jgi:hypothetical protein
MLEGPDTVAGSPQHVVHQLVALLCHTVGLCSWCWVVASAALYTVGVCNSDDLTVG